MLKSEQILIQPEFGERAAWYDLARTRGFGVEVVCFAFPKILNDPRVVEARAAAYEADLAGWTAPRTLHGAFVDILPHSTDRLVKEAARRRVRTCLEVAARLGLTHAIFHTGLNFLIRNPGYMERSATLQAEFWREMLEAFPTVTVCLENVWEPGPEILRSIVDQAAHPRLKVCFDVGHANVFSRVPPAEWLAALGEAAAYLHLNDNLGDLDSELPPGRGTVNWRALVEAADALPAPPLTVLELAKLDEIAESLAYLEREGLLRA